MDRIVLACAGRLDLGLQTTISRLAARHGAGIVVVSLDMGEGRDLEALRDRALAAGALRAHVIDARNEFARDFILPALKAGILDDRQGAKVLETLIVARTLVRIAGLEGAPAVAHGYPAWGAEARRLEVAVRTLDGRLAVIPAGGREESGAMRVPGALPHPVEAAHVEISFEKGEPKAINGVGMPLVDLITSLETIAGAPAALVLHEAHRALQQARARKADALSQSLARRYMALARSGQWFTAVREALDGQITKRQERLDGTIRLELAHGNCRVAPSLLPSFSELRPGSPESQRREGGQPPASSLQPMGVR
jgi:argininosuccinate synthase